eukprot:scaffold1411_cov125-Isochrysis_galbana.AAC.4
MRVSALPVCSRALGLPGHGCEGGCRGRSCCCRRSLTCARGGGGAGEDEPRPDRHDRRTASNKDGLGGPKRGGALHEGEDGHEGGDGGDCPGQVASHDVRVGDGVACGGRSISPRPAGMRNDRSMHHGMRGRDKGATPTAPTHRMRAKQCLRAPSGRPAAG